MKENMVYNPMYYQLREPVLRRMLAIMEGNKRCQKGGIVFVGDSLMQHYQAPHYLKTSRPIYNCGISGYTSKEMLMILDEAVLKYEPSLVFLHVGTNDLGDTLMRSPREIAWWLYQIADCIHHNLPLTHIVICSPLPCVERLQSYSVLKKGLRKNDILNMILTEVEKLLPIPHVSTLDIASCIVDDAGNPHENLFEDGLHLNAQGYEKISIMIQKCINNLQSKSKKVE